MLRTYLDTIERAKKTINALYQHKLKTISPQNWTLRLSLYLLKNYLQFDQVQKPEMFRVLKKDNLDSVLNELRAGLHELCIEAGLCQDECSDAVIKDIISECKTDPNLQFFTSQNRMVAYYMVIALSRCAKNYHDFKLALEKARATHFFAPGVVSNNLNRRINEAVALLDQSVETEAQDIKHAHQNCQLTLDSSFNEDKLNQTCEQKVTAYIEQHPNVKNYFKKSQDFKKLEHYYYAHKKLHFFLCARHKSLVEEIAAYQAGLAEPYISEEATFQKAACYDERPVSEIKKLIITASRLHIESLEGERNKLERKLANSRRSLIALRDMLTGIAQESTLGLSPVEKSFCEQYENKALSIDIVGSLLREDADEILSTVKTGAQAISEGFRTKLQITRSALSIAPIYHPRYNPVGTDRTPVEIELPVLA